MDHMDYGLSEPKLVLQQDGGVFVAGQVQAPMEAPQAPVAGRAANSAASLGSLSWLVGNTLFGTLNAPDWSVVNPVVDQGVEIAGKVTGGTFAAQASAIWKDIPLIVDRPALVKLNLSCGEAWDKEIQVKIEIPGDTSFNPVTLMAKPENKGFLGIGYKPSTKFLMDAFVLPQANVKADLVFKLTIKPPNVIPKEMNLTVPFKVAPPINVDLVPVDYVYKDASGARQQYVLSATELGAFKTSLESTLKELYPASLGQINVTVKAFRAIWSEDGMDLSGANLWQVDPSNPSVTFSGLLDPLATARGQKWMNLDTYFFQQMYVGGSSGVQHYAHLYPKNQYILGVVPVIAGVTLPTTSGTFYTAGGALRDSHFAAVMNQSALDAAHEVGHNHGRPHAPYGSVENPDPNWPTAPAYSGAAIGVPGWSVLTRANAPDKPATKKDIMCYPDDRSWYWISDYTFYYIYQWEKQSESQGDHD